MNNLSIPDLITLVSTKIPLDTTTSLAEADAIKMKFLSCIYDATNISGVSFLTSGRDQVKTPASIDDKDRTKNLVFIWLSCTIDAHNLGSIVFQEVLCLYFCLKLLQFAYDPSSGSIIVIYTPSKNPPVATISQPGTSLAS